MIIKPKTLPIDYSLEIWKESWRVVERKRFLFFVAVAIILILTVIISQMPMVGKALSGFLAAFLGAGFILLLDHYKKTGYFQFDLIFEALANKEYFSRILPLGAFLFFWNGLFSLLKMFLVGSHGDFLGSLIFFLSSIFIGVFTYFATPLLLFNDLKLLESLSLSAEAFAKNIVFFLCYSLIVFVVILLSFIPLFIGFLLLLAPLYAHGYLLYLKIYQDDSI